jgi:hypothetical protein
MTLWIDQTGHEYVVSGRQREDSVAHHRVLAFAWGLLDDLDDEREIDHLTPVPWLNIEGNLDAVDPEDHGRRTRLREARRGGSPYQARLDHQEAPDSPLTRRETDGGSQA